MHEIAHGLGPAYARTPSGQQVDIREAIGPAYSGLEEAKADVVGMFGLQLAGGSRRAAQKEQREEYYASYVAGLFRTLRFGTGEAHGRAEMMEFNYLVEHGAIKRLASGVTRSTIANAGRWRLGEGTSEIEATGDRERAENWFKKYDVMPAGAEADVEGRGQSAGGCGSGLLFRRQGEVRNFGF